MSFFQDKEFIKSQNDEFTERKNFPKHVDEIRKKLHPVLEKAKQEKKFSNVEKLIIENVVYRGPETKDFPYCVQIMER